jgi:hypothetical protein
MSQSSLVGAWKLVSVAMVGEGRNVPLWGERPQGQIIYTQEGRMAAELMAPVRQLWASADVRRATLVERAEAVDGYLSYSGRWESDGLVVKHHLEVCLIPNWVGTTQIRYLSYEGSLLVLSSAPLLFDGVTQVLKAAWCRF